MSAGNDKQVDFKGDNTPPLPPAPEKETPAPAAPDNTGFDFGVIETALRTGKPINVFGPMCSGKTTLSKVIADAYGYKEVKEELWDQMIQIFSPSGEKQKDYTNIERLEFYGTIGEHLAPAYEAAIRYVLSKHPEYLQKQVFNAWIPHLPEPFVNVYLLIRNDECMKKERNWKEDTATHFGPVREKAMQHAHEANAIVIDTDVAREALTRYLQSGGDDE